MATITGPVNRLLRVTDFVRVDGDILDGVLVETSCELEVVGNVSSYFTVWDRGLLEVTGCLTICEGSRSSGEVRVRGRVKGNPAAVDFRGRGRLFVHSGTIVDLPGGPVRLLSDGTTENVPTVDASTEVGSIDSSSVWAFIPDIRRYAFLGPTGDTQ